jgi:hypothetical protein
MAMKKLMITMLLSGLLFECHRRDIEPNCDTLATVTDLTKLSGCGYGFTLASGKVVIPGKHNHSKPMSGGGCSSGPGADLLANFQWADGMKVKIGYEVDDHEVSACNAGTVVAITCIQIVTASRTE